MELYSGEALLIAKTFSRYKRQQRKLLWEVRVRIPVATY